MKKSNFIVLPVLVALLLAGCTTTKKRGRRSSGGSSSQTSQKSDTTSGSDASSGDQSSVTSGSSEASTGGQSTGGSSSGASTGGSSGGGSTGGSTSGGTSSATGGSTGGSTSGGTSSATGSSTGGTTTGGTSSGTSSTTSGGGGSGGEALDVFDTTTPGQHVTTLDFVTKHATYKGSFPKVEATTGLYTVNLAGLDCNGVGCYCGSFNNLGYLFMRNKDNFASNHGHAFIANTASLGNISSIVFQPGSGASANAQYNIAILSSPVSTEGGSSAGTTFTGTGGTVTGSGGYFCITQLLDSVNGQIGTLTITYTIS